MEIFPNDINDNFFKFNVGFRGPKFAGTISDSISDMYHWDGKCMQVFSYDGPIQLSGMAQWIAPKFHVSPEKWPDTPGKTRK